MIDAQAANRHADRLGDRHRSFHIGVGQNRSEFFAAVAGGEVGWPVQRPGQHLCHRLEAVVPGGVAIGVIERLEMVDVDQE